jgi:predicted  nucleic acid-binding Zn-ribbon protein
MNAAQIMTQRKTDAAAAIEKELWRDKPNPEKVADCAIRGGLTPGELAEIEARISQGKATLAGLAEIDLAQLKAEGERTARETAEAQRIADAAQAEADRLAAISRDAGEVFEQAVHRIRKAACQVTSGALPADKVPEAVKRVVAFDKLTSEREQLEQNARQARHELNRLRGQQMDTERVLDELLHNKGFAYVQPGGVKSAKETHERQLEDLKKSIAQFEKNLPKLEKRAGAAGLKCKAAQKAIMLEVAQ